MRTRRRRAATGGTGRSHPCTWRAQGRASEDAPQRSETPPERGKGRAGGHRAPQRARAQQRQARPLPFGGRCALEPRGQASGGCRRHAGAGAAGAAAAAAVAMASRTRGGDRTSRLPARAHTFLVLRLRKTAAPQRGGFVPPLRGRRRVQ